MVGAQGLNLDPLIKISPMGYLRYPFLRHSAIIS